MYNDWEQGKKISGHSGCEAYLGKKKAGAHTLYFVKEYNRGVFTKRGRFASETLMYDRLKIEGIPKLEHNITAFKDKTITLYYVCEYLRRRSRHLPKK